MSPNGVIEGFYNTDPPPVGRLFRSNTTVRIRRISNHVATNYPWTVHYVDQSGGTSDGGGTISGCNLGNAQAKYMEDSVTPNFRRVRSKGGIIMNPMVSVQSERHADSVSLSGIAFRSESGTGGSTWTSWSVSGNCSPGAFAGFDERMLADLAGTSEFATALVPYHLGDVPVSDSELLSRVLARAGDSDTLFLVTMAELPKSLDFFYDGLKSAGRLVDNLSRLNIGVLRDLSRMRYKDLVRVAKGLATRKSLLRGTAEAARMWLGYRYGLMATYYDIMSWKESMGSKRTRVRFATTSPSFYTSGDIVSSGGTEYYTTTRTSRFSRSTLSSAGALCSLGMDGLEDSKGAFRILSTAWELTPLSFVLDWFADISQRIQALEGSVLRPTLGTWIVHRHQLSRYESYVQNGRVTGSLPGGLFTGAGNRGGSTTEDTRYTQRIANPTVSYLPELRVNLNWKKVADGVSLARVLGPKLKDVFSRL